MTSAKAAPALRGHVLVDAARGYEYEPLRTWVNIEPGQQQLELELKRWNAGNITAYQFDEMPPTNKSMKKTACPASKSSADSWAGLLQDPHVHPPPSASWPRR